ncbi:class I SAM-dependent methyltransferase, partial [uncultured Paracoccus sp.]|uniref:class I SAM-dependent rRNA methyltransferase n=1 Tax=uncultured Paracoccus sp. TaxID=189685 RepID=UPI0025F74200
MSELHSDDQTAGHPNDRAVIRLRPKSKPQAIRHGFPWVFADEAVLDRRTKALPPGGLAVLEDAERQPLALVTVNPVSKIIARVMDTDPGAVIDGAWLRARLTRALQMRERIYDEPFYRLVHAEADGLPGLVIDRFGDAAVIQPNAAWADGMAEDIADALIEVAGVSTVVLNGQGRSRGLEGLAERLEVIRGTAPSGPVQVRMNGATYLADLLGGQKTGLFFDQRPNHAFAQRLVNGGSVLDVFSHVGGFGLAALAAGADSALCIDGSAPALELARGGASAMGAADRLETQQSDAFDALEALAEQDRTFDVVVCDPPAFAPSKPALEKGLRAYER